MCQLCFRKDPSSLQIAPATFRLLRLFYSFDLSRLGTISVKPETKKELKTVITGFYDEYSGLMLKSKRFINQLEKFQGTN